jgi:hypothetical protein
MKIQWLKDEIEDSITNKNLGDAVMWQKKIRKEKKRNNKSSGTQ